MTNPTEDKLRRELEEVLGVHKQNVQYLLELLYRLEPEKKVSDKEYKSEWYEVRRIALTTLETIVNRERVKAEHRLAVKNAAIQSSLDQKIMILESKLKSVEEKKNG